MAEPHKPPKALEILHRHWPKALAFLWIPALYAVTLTPTPSFERPGPEPFMLCILCGDRGGADLVLNVVLYMPLGLLAAQRIGVWRTLLLGVLLSMGVELIQLFLPGRFSTLGDVVANGSGALAGAFLYRVSAMVGRGRRPGYAVGFSTALTAGGLVLLGGWLIEPSPTDEVYWGQWTPDFGPGTRYTGTVLSARLNGRPLPSRRLPDSLTAGGVILDDWTLSGTVEKGSPTRSVTSVLSIFDEKENEILYLGAYGEHLLLRERLRAQDWQLDRPELVAWDVLAPAEAGDTMRVSARRVGSDRCLTVDDREVCGLGLTPGRLWSLLLYPASASRGLRTVADFGVVFTLFLPLGFVATSRQAAALSAAVALVLVALAVAWTRLRFDWVVEPLAVLAGLGVGYMSAWALSTAGEALGHSTVEPATPSPPSAGASPGSA
ncbi:MAG: VanZ family protein [Dehalococcoidia bacterium]